MNLEKFPASLCRMTRSRSKKPTSLELAEDFNKAMADVIGIAEEACRRLRDSGEQEFMVANYKNAVQSFSKVVDYVRDFAGASSTAPVEKKIREMLATAEAAYAKAERSEDPKATFDRETADLNPADFEEPSPTKKKTTRKRKSG